MSDVAEGRGGANPRREPGEESGGGTIEYHFPVEVVVAGAMSDAEREAMEQRIFGALAEALARFA